jgi:hypothetical protein
MSREKKRSVAAWPKLPRLSSLYAIPAGYVAASRRGAMSNLSSAGNRIELARPSSILSAVKMNDKVLERSIPGVSPWHPEPVPTRDPKKNERAPYLAGTAARTRFTRIIWPARGVA